MINKFKNNHSSKNVDSDKASYISAIFSRNMLICVLTGFASGLPFFVLLQLLPAWLQTEGINIKTISAFTLTQFPYTCKFLWSPLIDNFTLSRLGRRRSWMIISQLVLFVFIALMGLFSPQLNITLIAVMSFAIALFSATQDIVIDAYRRELLTDSQLGLGNSIHIYAYRFSGLVPGALSLVLSEYLPWSSVFFITALFMLPAIITTLIIPEATHHPSHPKTIEAIFFEPLIDLLHRHGLKSCLLILAFIFFYKLGDSMATSLATSFYLQMGYSKLNIGLVAKNAAFWPSLIGSILGGILMFKIGINKALWLFGVVQLTSIFGFVWLSIEGPFDHIEYPELIKLAIIIAFEALGVGLGTAAFVSFIARTTNPAYTATQFALFTSFASIPRTLINGSAGHIVAILGWTNFFWLCALLGIPGMILLFKVAPWRS
jgi:MFS transporter, PAT family, beta-lactamase induction signal transducer AmpG